MLSPLMKIARAIRQRRLECRLSQRRLALLVECSQQYVNQVERGRRPVSAAVAGRIERALRVRAGKWTRGVRFFRGRPALAGKSLRALRALSERLGPAPAPSRVATPPRFPRPDFRWGLLDNLWPIGIHLGSQAARQVRALEAQVGADEWFWRRWNRWNFDSWSEKWLVLQATLAGARVGSASPDRVGCALKVVDGRSGRCAGKRAFPCLIWSEEDWHLVWFPQLTVRTKVGHRRPDNLLVVRRGGLRWTGVVEVDGPDFHQDRRRERERDEDLGVPVLHLAVERLATGAMDEIRGWLTGSNLSRKSVASGRGV